MPREMLKWSRDLPDWAAWGEDDKGRLRVELDPSVIYPKFLALIKEHSKADIDVEHPTQKMLQLALWVAQRRLKKLMYADGKNFIRFHIINRPEWADKNFPEGDSIDKRAVYKKLGLDKIRPEPEVEINW